MTTSLKVFVELELEVICDAGLPKHTSPYCVVESIWLGHAEITHLLPKEAIKEIEEQVISELEKDDGI